MRKKNKGAGCPPLLSAWACCLTLALGVFGCGGAEPPAGEPVAPEQKTVQDAAIPYGTLKRTPFPAPAPHSELPFPSEPALPQESELPPEPEPPPPSLAAILSEKGEAAYRQEDYALAEKRFREALIHEPELLHALTGLGWTLYDANRPDEAFLFFVRANKLYPAAGAPAADSPICCTDMGD